MHSGKASEPSEPVPGLVHSTAVQPSVKEEKKKKKNFHYFFFFSKHYNTHHSLGGDDKQLVQPDLLCFAVNFLSSFFFLEIWCLDLVLHFKQEYRELYLGGKILKVTLLSTF